MYLLAISGGPDSVFLLEKYKNKKIVIAHVNYHKRQDANDDQELVEKMCKKYNIALEILNVKEKPSHNFQNWAREIRYNFFKEIYLKYKCTKLLISHHKDDFIETAIMQQKSKRTPRYFGIKKNNIIKTMQIFRPFIDVYFKEDIMNILEKKQVKFAIDQSNNEPIFTRNKIRLDLNKKTKKEKQRIYHGFVKSNKILKKKFKRVDKNVRKIINSDMSLKFLRSINIDKKEAIYELVYSQFKNVKLSTKKIQSLIDFIKGKEGNKKFIIKNNHYIFKKNGKLIFSS